MKKLFPFILIVLIFVQLLAPFSISIGDESGNNFKVRNNTAEAADVYIYRISDVTPQPDGTRVINSILQSGEYNTEQECEVARATSRLGDTTTRMTSSGCFEVKSGTVLGKQTDELPTCSIIPNFKIGGCIAQFIYYLFFKTSSFVFALSGKIMDFTLMYSLSDTSYRSTFVIEGWGLMRDFCNMFFILVLLYIAIGTILDLHSVNTKQMIIKVIIIGLLINFSLFATQVIIDASNILARVFYNPQTIITGPQQRDANGNVIVDSAGNPVVNSTLGDLGEIKLSEAIVSKVDPQKIISSAATVDSIPVKGTLTGEDQERTSSGVTTSVFILVTLLATTVNVVGIIVFLSCALIFVGRVIMLWIAMIIAPLAFFSYTVPALQGIKMIGWRSWWDDTLKMAFLAPIFVFFMYIIVGFMEKGLSVVNTGFKSGLTGPSSIVAIIVPFAFIMVLLMRAKSIAVEFSGSVGAALSKAGGVVGGVVLGAATGGAALAMRASIGRAGSNINESEKWKKREEAGGIKGWAAGRVRDIAGMASKSSFDARATKLGASAGAGLGVDLGKAKQGGFVQAKKDQIAKSQKRAKELEPSFNSPEVRDLHQKEQALQELKNINGGKLAELDGKITAGGVDAREKAERATSLEKVVESKGQNATEEEKDEARRARADAVKASNDLQALKDQKKAIRENTNTGVYTTVTKKTADKYEKEAVEAETAATEAKANLPQKITEATNKVNETINNAITDATSSVEKAKADATASVEKAKADATKAEQAKTDAYAKTLSNPQDQNAQAAYQQALNNYNSAQSNVADTITKAGQSVIKAQNDAKAKIDEITSKADEMRNNAIKDINADIANKETVAQTARTKASTMKEGAKIERSMNEIEYQDIPEAHHTVEHIGNQRKINLAGGLENKTGVKKVFSYIISGGQYSQEAAEEAAHKIRMGSKIEESKKASDGGHGAGEAHKPAPAKADNHGGGGHDSHGGGGGHGAGH